MYPNMSDLNYFIEIASTGNLTQAATRLGVTQPTLSLALQRLESSLGAGLLLRSKKGVSLTPAGRTLLAHSRKLLQEWEGVQTKALASHHELKGTFTLGCHPSVALFSLPQFLPDLIRKHADLEIHLFHGLSRAVVDQVIAVNVDLGIVVNPLRHPDLVIKKVCEDEVMLWRGEASVPKDVIIADADLNQSQQIMKRFKKSGIEPKRFVRSSSLEVVASLTQSGGGLGILPSRVARRYGLKAVAQSPVFKDEICVVYRTESRSIKTVQILAAEIERALK